jgi:hypothetical protein
MMINGQFGAVSKQPAQWSIVLAGRVVPRPDGDA